MADRWLDTRGVAKYLSVREDRIPQLRRDGTLPEPSYALGARSPRWWSGDLDGVMAPGTASRNHRAMVDAIAEEIKAGR